MPDHAGAATLVGTGTFTGHSRRTSGSVWRALPTGLAGRQQSSAAAIGSTLYLMGGGGGPGPTTPTDNLAYDAVLNTWTSKAPLPIRRQNGSAVAAGGYVYYVGGWDPSLGYTNTLYRYDPVANTWLTTLATIPITAVGEAVYDAVMDRILFVQVNGSGTTMYLYDVALDSWSAATQPVIGSGGRGVFHAPNSKAYFQYATQFWEYEPTTGTFTSKAAVPVSYTSTFMFSYADRVWIVGGGGAGVGVGIARSYDPATNGWEVRDDLVVARYFHTGAVVDGKPMVLMGNDKITNVYVSDAELYVPPEDSEASLSMTMELYTAMLGKAQFSMDMTLAASEFSIDPRRLNPGFIKVGYRPVGFTDPVNFSKIAAIPFPAPTASDIYVGTGTQTTAPTQLDEYAYVSDGQYFYLISGYWSGGSWNQWWSNRIYRFDAETETWTELAHLPGYVGSEGCKAGLIDGKIYVVMGDTDYDPFGALGEYPDPEFQENESMLQSLWIYDIVLDTWERGPQPPFMDSYGTATVLNDKLYLVQNYGIDWDESTGFAEYDPVTETWTVLANQMFTSWDAPVAWAGDGKVWVASYQDDFFGVQKNYIISYDPDAATPGWTDETDNFTGETLPWFEASAVFPVSATTVRIVGGHEEGSLLTPVGRFSSDVNFVTKTISNPNLRFVAAGVTDDDGYFGGFYYNGVTYTTGPWNSADIQSMWRAP